MPTPVGWVDYDWDGQEGYLWDAKVWVKKGPATDDSGAAIIFLAPPGGRAQIPALVKGDPGLPFTPGEIDVTELAYDSATPMTAEWVLATPATDVAAAVYDLNLSLRTGNPGDAEDFRFLDADDIVGTPIAGYELAYVADTGTAVGGAATSIPGAKWTPPKVGDVYWPASVLSTTSADGAQRTLGQVTVPALPFAWRPHVNAQSTLTATGVGNVRSDLIARIGNAVSGDIVARGYGIAGLVDRIDICAAPPPGSASAFGRVEAGVGPTTITLRGERQSGSDSFSTSASTTIYSVEVVELPT